MQNQDSVTVNPYLTFDGNCKEVMNFYHEVLGGELEIMPFDGSPAEVPEDYKQKVMHASLRFGNAVIMASDGMPDNDVTFGDAFSISIGCSNVTEGERIFNALSKNGTVIMPFAEMFWGAKFGLFIDQFGVRWMVNCQLDASA